MITIEDVLRIAIDAHEGQKDLDGKPVILHPLTVGLAGKNREEMIAGFLHDVVEDTGTSFDDLLEKGVEKEVVDTLRGTAPIVEIIGDCGRPGNIREAVFRGHHAALDL